MAPRIPDRITFRALNGLGDSTVGFGLKGRLLGVGAGLLQVGVAGFGANKTIESERARLDEYAKSLGLDSIDELAAYSQTTKKQQDNHSTHMQSEVTDAFVSGGIAGGGGLLATTLAGGIMGPMGMLATAAVGIGGSMAAGALFDPITKNVIEKSVFGKDPVAEATVQRMDAALQNASNNGGQISEQDVFNVLSAKFSQDDQNRMNTDANNVGAKPEEIIKRFDNRLDLYTHALTGSDAGMDRMSGVPEQENISNAQRIADAINNGTAPASILLVNYESIADVKPRIAEAKSLDDATNARLAYADVNETGGPAAVTGKTKTTYNTRRDPSGVA